MATSTGHSDRAGHENEDFAGVVPGALVLIDGAGIPGTESICRHGVAWYAHRLGGLLLGLLSRGNGVDLASVLADAIDEIAADHRDTCDITNVSSPQATVAILRCAESRAEYLLLGDSWLVLDRVEDDPLVLTDERELAVRHEWTAPLAGLAAGTPEYEQALERCIEAIQARRNQDGGYWIAKDDPRAAAEAVTGSLPLPELKAAALLSNGASRIVSPYECTDWPGVLRLLASDGPAEIIRQVRQAEGENVTADHATVPDDATVIYCTGLRHAVNI